jgi:hypothetical protein
MTKVDIELHLSFLKNEIDPDITVKLDQRELLSGKQSQDTLVIKLQEVLDPGPHRLSICYHNMTKLSVDSGEMAVIIDRVCFQNVDHDFKFQSRYVPEYPAHWVDQHTTQGKYLASELHSNYLGWNGVWFLDFHVPIYRWIHQQMDLGWLI